MVPKREEPLYLHSHYFITPKRTIFAASNFDTTSELTLQIVGWGATKSTCYETDNKRQHEHIG